MANRHVLDTGVCLTDAMQSELEQVARWSAAIRDYDPLEPWLTESAQDENYWNDVAQMVLARLGVREDEAHAFAALRDAFVETFPGIEFRSENGFYRDNLDERMRRIADQALS